MGSNPVIKSNEADTVTLSMHELLDTIDALKAGRDRFGVATNTHDRRNFRRIKAMIEILEAKQC